MIIISFSNLIFLRKVFSAAKVTKAFVPLNYNELSLDAISNIHSKLVMHIPCFNKLGFVNNFDFAAMKLDQFILFKL